MDPIVADLVKDMLGGSVGLLSRLITLVENNDSDTPEVMKAVEAYVRGTRSVGITGAPGTGKSTLIGQLIAAARQDGLSVGVVAVDPSSPRHGGAVLGDRIRMIQHGLDNEVFIRSMATRGSYGGLSRCTGNVVKLLDAFGKDMILVETVGVGQTECAIAEVADIIVLVLSPESGDNIQFMKAGIMEIADVIVVNKADLGNADTMVAELKALLTLGSKSCKPDVTVLKAEALNNVGVKELLEELQRRGLRRDEG